MEKDHQQPRRFLYYPRHRAQRRRTVSGILGFTSPCFFQYDFSHYDTEAEALRAMKWKKGDHLAHGGSWAVSDDYGIMHCEKCGSELLCNDSGDMPEYCPQCGRQIDWASFDF